MTALPPSTSGFGSPSTAGPGLIPSIAGPVSAPSTASCGSKLLRYCYPSSTTIAGTAATVGGCTYLLTDFHLNLYLMNTYSQGLTGAFVAPYVLQNVKAIITPISTALAGASIMTSIIILNLIAERFFEIKPSATNENQIPTFSLPTPSNVTAAIKSVVKRKKKASAPLPTSQPEKETPKATSPSSSSISSVIKDTISSSFLAPINIEKKPEIERPAAASTFYTAKKNTFFQAKDILDDGGLPFNCFGFITEAVNSFKRIGENFQRWRLKVKMRKLERATAKMKKLEEATNKMKQNLLKKNLIEEA